ncbi:hypothetical protein HAX54_049895 [Datura stramonium]|uniref:Uncharacterized protein n=1 Tax=Datura stramonium TaxID=4076 RepID=A0ABS8SW48_DATST|nr:hypothetical protein [Datura stramonium]
MSSWNLHGRITKRTSICSLPSVAPPLLLLEPLGLELGTEFASTLIYAISTRLGHISEPRMVHLLDLASAVVGGSRVILVLTTPQHSRPPNFSSTLSPRIILRRVFTISTSVLSSPALGSAKWRSVVSVIYLTRACDLADNRESSEESMS